VRVDGSTDKIALQSHDGKYLDCGGTRSKIDDNSSWIVYKVDNCDLKGPCIALKNFKLQKWLRVNTLIKVGDSINKALVCDSGSKVWVDEIFYPYFTNYHPTYRVEDIKYDLASHQLFVKKELSTEKVPADNTEGQKPLEIPITESIIVTEQIFQDECDSSHLSEMCSKKRGSVIKKLFNGGFDFNVTMPSLSPNGTA